MSRDFDPYLKWLGIRPKDQPPTHYRLLGIDAFEHDPDIIESAADQRMMLLRTFQTGEHGGLSQKLLAEVAAAKLCLLDDQKRAAYDEQLRAADGQTSTADAAEEPTGQARVVRRATKSLPQAQSATAGPAAQAPVVQTDAPSRIQRRSKPLWLQPIGILGVLAVLLSVGTAAYVLRSDEEVTPIAEVPPAEESTTPEDFAGPDTSPPYTPPTTPRVPSLPVDGGASDSPAVNPDEEPDTSPVEAPDPEPMELSGLSVPATSPPETSPPVDEPPRQPVPETVALKKLTDEIRGIYADEFAAAEEDPDAAAALIEKLRRQAGETTEDAAARYALLLAARELAIAALSNETAIEITRTIAEGYKVERWDSIADTMQQLYAAARSTAERKMFVPLAASVAGEALSDEAFDSAKKIAEEGKTAALRARDGDLRKQMETLLDQIQQQQVLWRAAQAAQEKLAENPDDPAANETWGSYLCLVRGDWREGLAHLAKSGDEKLKQLAAADLADPSSPAEQMSVADGWWEWIDAKKNDRQEYLASAHYWYTRALPDLSGLDKARAEQRLKEIGKLPRERTATGSVQVASSTPTLTNFSGGTSPPLPKSDSVADQVEFNRKMAEWGLQMEGAVVTVILPDGSLKSSIRNLEDLPQTPFMIRDFHLPRGNIVDGDVPKLVALTKLAMINLSYIPLSSKALALFERSSSVQMLRVYETSLDDQALTQLCRQMPQLYELQIGATAVTDQGLEAIGKLPALARLYLMKNQITDDGLAHLRSLKTLEHLNLDYAGITSRGMRGVGDLKSLILLRLGATAVDDEGMSYISGLSQLRDLSVVETNVGNAGLAHISKLRSLQRLTLSRSKVTGSGLSHLGGMPALVDLALTGLEIDDQDLAHLRSVPKLRSLYLGNTNLTDDGLHFLAQIPTLTGIRLEGTGVTNAGVMRLQAALPRAKIVH